MASTIKVDNVQNQPGTNVVNKCGTTVNIGAASDNIRSAGNNLQASDGGNLISQSGTTVTLGASGDTIALAAGASQTGFGRTGTVNWNTTPVTSTPTTGVSGSGYFINSTGAIKTIKFPASPSAGDIMAVADYAGTAGTYTITIDRNGSNVEGMATDAAISSNRDAVTFVYVDGVQGWVPVNDNESSAEKNVLIAATGGTPCAGQTCGDYRYHTFTGPGTLCVTAGAGPVAKLDYMIVAGGGGGGNNGGAGGGAGGFREAHCATVSGVYTASPLATCASLPISAGPYAVTVGGGGPGGGSPFPANKGNDSIFSTITSTGGGFGGNAFGNAGGPGGSGGGGGGSFPCAPGGLVAGNGNDPVTSPSQGFPGGTGAGVPPATARPQENGGGGGASAAGTAAVCSTSSGPGGNGVTTSINTSPTVRAGGGGGGTWSPNSWGPGSPAGSGGSGGGGAGGRANSPCGAHNPSLDGGNGGCNTGGGGGGAGRPYASSGGTAGNGGSGVVIVRYKFQ